MRGGPSLHSTVSSSWKALIKYLGAVLLTVKPIPTVAAKFPGWNLPVSNWTNNEVLPTPLSPRRIVCKHTREGTLDYFTKTLTIRWEGSICCNKKKNLYLDHESLKSSFFQNTRTYVFHFFWIVSWIFISSVYFSTKAFFRMHVPHFFANSR